MLQRTAAQQPSESPRMLMLDGSRSRRRGAARAAPPTTPSLSRHSGVIRHDAVRSGAVCGTARLIPHPSRAATIRLGAIKARRRPRDGGRGRGLGVVHQI